MILNLTPHPVRVVLEEGGQVVFEPEPVSARLTTQTVRVGQVGQIPLTQTEFGRPEGLPDSEDGVWLIVSQLVQTALPRRDLLVPAEVIRDERGNVIGCRSLGLLSGA